MRISNQARPAPLFFFLFIPLLIVFFFFTLAGADPDSKNQLPEDDEKEKLLIEYLSLRGEGVLLRQGKFTVENSFSYSLNESNRRFIEDLGLGPELVDQTLEDEIWRYDLIVRYGILDELQFAVNVPYLSAERKLDFLTASGLELPQDLNNDGLGDVGLSLHHHTLKEANLGFDLISFMEGFIPTDFEPETNFVSNDPIISLGQFGITGGFTLVKPEDPALLFLTLGIGHFFSNNIAGLGNLNSFTTFGYSLGFSLALNDNFAPFISVSGTTTLGDREITVPGSTPLSQDYNRVNFRMGFDYRLTQAIYIEPSVTFGLSEDASDVLLNISVPYQF